MTERGGFRYNRLAAPVALILFAVGWYQFSVVYIQAANLQLIEGNDLSVYVPIQQVQAYLEVTQGATYLMASIGLAMFAYYLARFVRSRRSSS